MLKIGVDGGGTTTRAVVIKIANGEIEELARAQAGSSNHYSVTPQGAAQNIESAIVAALEKASVARKQIEGYGFALAGACTPVEHETLRKVLSPLCHGKPAAIEEDVVGAQSGAFGGEPGAVCIAGTGANCFGINENGERARADGLGPLLGDRGGGYRIGEAALRALCAADDGSGPTTSLLASGLKALEVESVDELVQLVYRPDFTRDRIAAVFPVVIQEAKDGDGVASELLQNAGHELAATTLSVLQELNLQRVAVVGGVLENSTVVRQSFENALREKIADIEVLSPRYDAAIGAALL